MTKGIHFHGHIDKLAYGEPMSLHILSTESNADSAAAVTVSALMNRALRLSAYLPKAKPNDDPLCEVEAWLPPIETNITTTRSNAVLVKLKVSASGREQLIRLFADKDKTLRWEFSDAGTAAPRKREAKPKGEHGKFWELMHSFHNRPDVRRWLGVEVGYAQERDALQRFYQLFNVTSRTFISPDVLRDWVARMPDCDSALTAIENAKAKTQ